MRTKLLAPLVGVATICIVGVADAAEVATPPDPQVVRLTNTQMDEVTASHLYAPPIQPNKAHDGWYWIEEKLPFLGWTYIPTKGIHYRCGARQCNSSPPVP